MAAVFFWFARPTVASLWLGAGITAAGILVRAWAAGTLEKNWRLTVEGPYAFTRNPLYLGSLVVGLGASAASARPWFALVFLAFFAWMYGSTMTAEAENLEEVFGEDYVRYRDRVPLLFPCRAPYRVGDSVSGETSFSIRRYGRNKEYEALLGAVAGFAVLILKAAHLGRLFAN